MRKAVLETLALTTERLTWVSTGTVPGSISCAIRDRNETLVSSAAATSSGNGFYYSVVTMPASQCWLVNEWRAVINGDTYYRRQFIHVLTQEVD